MTQRLITCEHLGALIDPIAGCGCPRKFGYKCKLNLVPKARPGFECETCTSYVPSEITETQKHLLYHLYPNRANEVWKWNVEQMRKHLWRFNGAMYVYVARDYMCAPMAEVRSLFANDAIQFREIVNDPSLGEVSSWCLAWRELRHLQGTLYYAHGKGVSHPYGSPAMRWAELLYETLFNRMDDVETKVQQFGVACSLVYRRRLGRSTWHPAGTFFAVDIEKAKRHAYEIAFKRFGVEDWPGIHFPIPGVVFKDGIQGNPYSSAVVDELWKEYRESRKL